MSIRVVLNKSNSNCIELIERVKVRENSRSIEEWNLTDKYIERLTEYFQSDYDIPLKMI